MSEHITTQAAAKLLGVSYDHGRKLLHESGLKPVDSIGRNYFWDREQVEALKNGAAT